MKSTTFVLLLVALLTVPTPIVITSDLSIILAGAGSDGAGSDGAGSDADESMPVERPTILA